MRLLRLSPFNVWIGFEKNSHIIHASIEVSRNQPDLRQIFCGKIARISLKLVALLFRNEPGVRGRRDTLPRMVDALAPIFDGEKGE